MTSNPLLNRPIRKVLVANRGEIAVRVLRTLAEQNIASVAVYSDADAHALHVSLADESVRLGPASAAESYLDIAKVIDAAVRTGADAVHPGYGFLSENASFATALAEAGIVFIGPPATAIATMGDKITARAAVTARGVPVVPGLSRPGLTDADLIAAAPEIGFPVLIKPSAGGGGKGMHRVELVAELPSALITARREAAAAFGDDSLFLEHFVDTPRHIEVQILADAHGTVVHLGERECSLQRRHQKVIEEAPSALLDAATRARIGAAACDAARSVGYTGAGTVEFIVSAHRPADFFFMEMNTRLQVEHPVTELVTGIDLVAEQLRIADGGKLTFTQDDVRLTGHAIEARVYAEDPANGFLPTGGTLTEVRWPRAARVDSGVRSGSIVGSDYDPMLAKVIVHAADRPAAIDALDAALAQTRLTGVVTNVDFCRQVLAVEPVRSGALDTSLLDQIAANYRPTDPPPQAWIAAALGALDLGSVDDLWSSALGFRIGAPSPYVVALGAEEQTATVTAALHAAADARSLAADVQVSIDDTDVWAAAVALAPRVDGTVDLRCDGVDQNWTVRTDTSGSWVASDAGTWLLRPRNTLAVDDEVSALGDVTSPMPGTVVAVAAVDRTRVAAGDPLVVLEAMKMEHTLRAPADGIVSITVRPGDKVAAAAVLAHITTEVGPDEGAR